MKAIYGIISSYAMMSRESITEENCYVSVAFSMKIPCSQKGANVEYTALVFQFDQMLQSTHHKQQSA